MTVINMTQYHLDSFRRMERAKQAALFKDACDFFSLDDELPEDSIREGLEDIAAGRVQEITSAADLLEDGED